MGRRKDNHKNGTNQCKLKINGYKEKYNKEHIKLFEKMIRGEEKFTFKNICKYLWSLIVLGVNWVVYRKVFVVLLTVMILATTLVYSPVLGIILCILTPVFLEKYGKYFHNDVMNKYENIEKTEKQNFLIPSSLLIIWILIIALVLLVIAEFI